uniref:Glycine cleavage system P-protein N-terminal domain-containing protein n=1 Tax=Timema bartmani TaxID=61472 RepID=A0A7R9F6F4_9NEOP|nr:unnamed protein product [Timema bartmani]
MVEHAHENGTLVCFATDLLALTVLRPPSEFDADVAVGSSQRFGVPLGYGGPHAGFFACRQSLVRLMPGRMIGVTRGLTHGSSWQSPIAGVCKNVVLTYVTVFYTILTDYYNPNQWFVHTGVRECGNTVNNAMFFDTVKISPSMDQGEIQHRARQKQINLRLFLDGTVGVSLDETVSEQDVEDLLWIFGSRSSLSECQRRSVCLLCACAHRRGVGRKAGLPGRESTVALAVPALA